MAEGQVEWLQIIKRGRRVMINGKDTNVFVLNGVEFEVKDDPDDSALYLRALAKPDRPIWEEI